MREILLVVALVCCGPWCQRPALALEFPGPQPGEARAQIEGDTLLLENDVLRCRWSIVEGQLKPAGLTDKIAGRTLSFCPIRSECFRVVTPSGASTAASQMRLVEGPVVESLQPDTEAVNLGRRHAGKQIRLTLADESGHLQVDWRAVLRDGSNYVRPIVTLRAGERPVEVQRLILTELSAIGDRQPRVVGTVPGSPVVLDTFFFAYEHANSTALAGEDDNLALGKTATASGQYHQLAPSLAVDGGLERERHWGATDVPVWWQVDLGSTQRIDRVHLFTWYNGRRYYQYKIETSADGKAWSAAVDRTENTRPATRAGDDHRFEPHEARFVRVTVTHNSEGNHFGGHLIEVRVFAAAPDTEAALPGGKTIRCSLARNAPVRPSQPVTQSSVIGVAPQGQLRRGFLHYVERERAHPYRPFLHYNSWYDTSWPGHRMHEAECLEVVELFGRELVRKRGVPLGCFLWDDGWDNPQTLWRIDKQNFPNGFREILRAAKQYDSTSGFWLSPWGGYGNARKQRIEFGRQQGFETRGDQFSMAGPRYYQRFLEASRRMITENGCNHFKYDGMSAARIEESEAMVRLIAELRRLRPELFINMTTGTWPSPFYLWHGDSTWRGGGDMGSFGPGSKREQWVTYRDLQTYHGVVRRGPLYPLNSLMTQGIAHARFGRASQNGEDPAELRREIRSFFASGTCVQELYVTPQMLSPQNWDDLAEAARWAHAHADVLVDTHWIGGDPQKLEVYGWASWAPRGGILALRNPNDKLGSIRLDPAVAFELPPGASQHFELRSPWKDDARQEPLRLSAGREHAFQLQPFEVLVFDAAPEGIRE